jgi:hypothetical protein
MQRHGLRQELNLVPNNPTIVASIHTELLEISDSTAL